MSAFKTLTSKDFIIAPLNLNKGFRFEGATSLTASNVNIERYLGKNSNFFNDKTQSGNTSKEYESLVYHQIKQLYYSNYISGSNGEVANAPTASITPQGLLQEGYYPGGIISASFDTTYNQNFLTSNLEAKRYFPTGSNETIGVLSIPQYMFGDYIQPNSISITTNSGSYFDDGEGRLKRTVGNSSIFVGNVIYEHGIIILTGGTRRDTIEGGSGTSGYGFDIYGEDVYGNTFGEEDILNFVTGSEITCSFSSSYTIYETQYSCTIGESEFNISQNPSIADENGNVLGFVSQSYFSPYVTTVGLYNDQKDLLAVGKLAKPLLTSKTTDTTILINIDRQ